MRLFLAFCLSLSAFSTMPSAVAAGNMPLVSYKEDKARFRLVCDESMKATFTNKAKNVKCMWMQDWGTTFIEKHIAAKTSACDDVQNGAKLRALMGPQCSALDKLIISKGIFARTSVCLTFEDDQNLAALTGRPHCNDYYRAVIPCTPHTHSNGVVHNCEGSSSQGDDDDED